MKMSMAGKVCKLFLEYHNDWFTRKDISERTSVNKSWVPTVMKSLQKQRMFDIDKAGRAYVYRLRYDKIEEAQKIRDTPRTPPATAKGWVLNTSIEQLLRNTEQLLLAMGAYEHVRKEYEWGGGKGTRTELERRPLKYGTPEDEAFLDKLTATIKELLDMREGIEKLSTEIGLILESEE